MSIELQTWDKPINAGKSLKEFIKSRSSLDEVNIHIECKGSVHKLYSSQATLYETNKMSFSVRGYRNPEKKFHFQHWKMKYADVISWKEDNGKLRIEVKAYTDPRD